MIPLSGLTLVQVESMMVESRQSKDHLSSCLVNPTGKYDGRIASIEGSPFFMSSKPDKKDRDGYIYIRPTYKLKTSIKGKGF